jgi:hypothetical protein
MKELFYIFLPLILGSCCLGNAKCKLDNNDVRFRIVNATSGEDLLFGATKIYDKDSIRLYSINGNDTIFHFCKAGANPNPGQDSLLYVTFDQRKYQNVILEISDSDVDTISLDYPTTNVSPCCEDYTTAVPRTLNSTPIEILTGGISLLKKR